MGSAPRIGQPVHYVARGSADGVFHPACRAAIVTEIGEARQVTDDSELWTVGLAVLNPTGLFFDPSIEEHDGHAPGTWHYPCVPAERTLSLIETTEED